MRKQFSKLALVATLGLALTFTFSCSGGGDDGGNDPNGGTSSPSSSPSGGGSSSSGGGNSSGSNSGGGSCDISSYKKVEMPDGKTWMAENLNCKVADSECYKKEESNCNTYGRLYSWEAANKACSGDWRLPNNDDWDALMTAVGGKRTAGKYLKATSGWDENGNGEGELGFAALPGGNGYDNGNFGGVGYYGRWWSANEYDSNDAYHWDMSYDSENVDKSTAAKDYSLYSVRCIKDN